MDMIQKLSNYTSNEEIESYFEKIYACSEDVLAGKIHPN